MDIELVAQMFQTYQSNVLFHLEGWWWADVNKFERRLADEAGIYSYGESEGSGVETGRGSGGFGVIEHINWALYIKGANEFCICDKV